MTPEAAAEPAPKRVGLYTPDPDRALLAATDAAARNQRGRVTVGFCITEGGTTEKVEVIEPFEGDAQVDAIAVATVETWRFDAPDGPPLPTCTRVSFVINFVKHGG